MRKWLAAFAEEIASRLARRPLGPADPVLVDLCPLILSSGDPVYRSSLLYTLAAARDISSEAGQGLPGLPRITAWSGVIAAALVVQGGRPGSTRARRGAARARPVAPRRWRPRRRSPTEQIAAVKVLGQLRAVYAAGRREIPELAGGNSVTRRSAPCSR